VLLDDGTIAVIDPVRFGSYWLDSHRQEPAVALGRRGSTSTGVVFRRSAYILYRVAASRCSAHS